MPEKLIKITDTQTGKVYEHLDKDFNESYWEEGNYSCDCNRGLVTEVYTFEDAECSEGRFKIDYEGREAHWDEKG